jgi:LL-diaminopimelate aminotransferase
MHSLHYVIYVLVYTKPACVIFVLFEGKKSWDVFSEFLEKVQVVTTPGSGFGPGGEGYVRMSAFAPREDCIEACRRFKEFYKQ